MLTRLSRERLTITRMVELYCRGNHRGGGDLCIQCRTLLSYALDRIDHCRYGGGKSVCSRCPVHCFRPEMRALVCEVMRYSGPRMVFRHPLLAVLHFLDMM